MITLTSTKYPGLNIKQLVYLLALIVGIILILTACGKDDAPTNMGNPPGPNEIFIQGNAFSPQDTTIAVGTTIKWINKDAIAHTVTSGVPGAPDGTFDSGNLGQNGEFSFTFNQAGTFDYFCNIHHSMTGKIIVQ